MGFDVKVPELLGEATEAVVATWFKKPGDIVETDELLCELETDKVTIEVPAPEKGVLEAIVAPEGTTVAEGELIAMIVQPKPILPQTSDIPLTATFPSANYDRTLLVTIDDAQTALEALRTRVQALLSNPTLLVEDATDLVYRARGHFLAVFMDTSAWSYFIEASGIEVDDQNQVTHLNLRLVDMALARMIHLLDRTPMAEPIEVPAPVVAPPVPKGETPPSNRVFIVHGHEEAILHKVCRALEKLKLEPVVLNEQPDRGLTIIEKFERETDVGFAVVLMTADDLGEAQGPARAGTLNARARQNVVLELGYFMAKLGRSRVCVLKDPEVETPSDILGIIYTPLDARGSWRYELADELKAAGYAVDLNDL